MKQYNDINYMEVISDPLYAEASEEARRLYEHDFSYYNPYTVIIDDHMIPFYSRDRFYELVKTILYVEKGEHVSSDPSNPGYFKIDRYQFRK